MTKLSIGLGQMRIALGDVDKNFDRAERLIEGASRKASDLVIAGHRWRTSANCTGLFLPTDGFDRCHSDHAARLR